MPKQLELIGRTIRFEHRGAACEGEVIGFDPVPPWSAGNVPSWIVDCADGRRRWVPVEALESVPQ